ncbi:hypothetical protein QBC47DRAFT_361965 [Echria macrotheca]|uniref:Secreted protein n=1 Tax=Echria macrotheca TaxID=438768 RepID=A0AAJ0B939_9PEZI|nr:hypothetical protein QBC47DRAFT_361965 [Echria macrotheca]
MSAVFAALTVLQIAWAARRGLEQHEIDAHLSEKLAADLARPFGQSTGQSASIHKRLQCALFHKVDCMCYHSIAFGALKCCPLCDTDFAINIAPDAAPGWPDARVLVFTTWKCLGDGTKRSRYWRSHQTPAEPGSERHYGPGHAHWTYESGSCKLKHTINVPEIQRLIALARSSPKGCPPQYSPIQHA